MFSKRIHDRGTESVLTQYPDGWRIRRCQLNVTWVTGDRSIFDIARSLGDRG